MLQRECLTCLYWCGFEYQPGAFYTLEGDHTFVAQWKDDTIPPNPSDDTPSPPVPPEPTCTPTVTPPSEPPSAPTNISGTGDTGVYPMALLLIIFAAAGSAAFAVLRVRRSK